MRSWWRSSRISISFSRSERRRSTTNSSSRRSDQYTNDRTMPRERPLTVADPTDHPTHPRTAKAQNRGIRITGTHRFPRGPRARRGDVRAAALLLLAEEPRNGYQIMQEIEQRSGGVWRPSPGSVYPALAQLEDEGLVRLEERDGRRTYVLTDGGRAYVDDRRDDLVAPWEEMSESVGDDVASLFREMRQVGMEIGRASC